ncbi:MAG: hypothetical protein K6F86_09465 [Lachnospiraceae bacterium]|nr:hypothetical protein [Lachnospiraceae bacterium]
MGIFRASGMAAGLVAGLIICVILFRYMNKDKKILTKYDERQEMARGRAYKYGFWASMATAAVVMITDVAEISLASSFTKYFFIMFVGILVQVTYSIFNDAYLGINTNKKRLMIICIIAGLCNLLGVVGNIKGGTFIVNGVVSDAGTNLLCCILMVVIGIELLIKDSMDRKHATAEESGD